MKDASGLLVKVRGNAGQALNSLGMSAAAGDIEPILSVNGAADAPAEDAAFGMAGAGGPATWFRIEKGDSENPWDRAHELLSRPASAFSAAGANVLAVEPDLEQAWDAGDQAETEDDIRASSQGEFCTFDDQKDKGGRPKGPDVAWNLGDAYSGLAKARARVGEKQKRILIAHLDTGYDPKHATLPRNLRLDIQKNFVKGDGSRDDASDQTPEDKSFFRNRGHGAGTLGLLAGGALSGDVPAQWAKFKGELGGAPLAQIIPIRIADWVVRFKLGSMIQGFNHARECGAHVLSMSMGGVASNALVDAVNEAYDAGIFMVTASGNNIAGAPTPKSVVFPARFKRVIAACGVMADGRAYTKLGFGTLQGNFGPKAKMDTALGGYTPNVPWAQIDCGAMIDMDGSGTSSATPQIAAAAALWIAEHWDALAAYPEPWMRVEAARHALFSAARKVTPAMDAKRTFETIGQGVLDAAGALSIKPIAREHLVKLPRAKSSWSWLNLIFGQGGVSIAQGIPRQRQEMLMLELTQIAQRVRDVDEAIDDPDRPAEEIPASAKSRYLEAALDQGNPSKALESVLVHLLGKSRPAKLKAPKPRRPLPRKVRPLEPPRRRLRVYALDPSIGKNLELLPVAETTLSVPWDSAPAAPEPMQPGPIGEYLEVIDVDPASGKVYDPVDLNDPYLLAQDGLAPSEGNPQFHQQMVYAVGMTTIGHFERALGRPALWAPEGDKETKRLRIYPHALRDENAYYSPLKKALLFGYFQARSDKEDATAPGSMVFSCLSADIIAHEMTHALLDGLHRRFEEPSNPDVVAFHEAFADIVALFQHFTVTELVRFEIGRARGDLSAAKLLGGLAREFGEGANRRGPLRNYLDPKMRELVYDETMEPHARGSILVFAVYDAFLNVVARRTADLVRLATGGSGVLPAGAIHPDLVNRLTTETCETAQYFLHMCIRALDYCPPVDITFGEYLRAIITADRDLVVDDRYGYRTAIMEAFRRRGILPNDVRTVSEETLAWGGFADDDSAWLQAVMEDVEIQWTGKLDRTQIFERNNKNRWKVFNGLVKAFNADPSLMAHLGLAPKVPKYNREGKALEKPPRGATTFEVHNVRPARRIAPDGTFHNEIVAVITQRQAVAFDGKNPANGFFWFRGGATLIIDPAGETPRIRYSIIKSSSSQSRLERQRLMNATSFMSPLRALYFGADENEPFALIHADREAHRG